jgi:(R,R)-butanediol dehydrogenase/meso-butanediol dehydrogenase/diacetyl reductase
MRAVVVDDGLLVVRDVPEPVLEPGQLLLDVAACGVCGSDLKMAGLMPAGTILGHELVGEVLAAADDVASDWPVGTLVAAMPAGGCGECRDCADDDPARCGSARLMGVGSAPGAFAERVAVTAAESVALPPGTSPSVGALVEPMAVGLHLANAVDLQAGQRVLILGGGSVGLSVLLWARFRGAAHVTVSDPSAPRREGALSLGADAAVDPADGVGVGSGYDVVVECVGATGMVAAALGALRPRGKAVIGGVCLEEDSFWPVAAVTTDVTLAFASYYTRSEFAEAAARLASGEIDVSGLVTGQISLDELPAMLEELKGPTAHRKVLVLPRG